MHSSFWPATIRWIWLVISSKVRLRTLLHKCSDAARLHIPVLNSSWLKNKFCIFVPSVYKCQYGPLLINMLSQILSFSEKLRALKSFFIDIRLIFPFLSTKTSCFVDRSFDLTVLSMKMAFFVDRSSIGGVLSIEMPVLVDRMLSGSTVFMAGTLCKAGISNPTPLPQSLKSRR